MPKHLWTVLTLIILFTWCSNTEAKQPEDEQEHQLESITVTAQKREEDPDKVPISMDVFSEVDVEDSMISNSLELTRLSPNLFMKDNALENVIIIRGISSFSHSLNTPASYYVNGVGYALQYMHENELFDIERIEVLKGPQGTLYGRNSESGVINIITRQPDNDFRAKILGEYGSYNSYRGNASISGPIIENKLYVGAALQYKASDGFMENIYYNDDKAAESKHFNGRATLRWTPSQPWDISLIADVLNSDDKIGVFRFAKGPFATDPYKINHDITSNDYSEDGNSQIMNINYTGDFFKITSVTGAAYRTYTKLTDSDMWINPSNQSTNMFRYDDNQYTQELRIASVKEGPLQWLGGLFGVYEETDLDHKSMAGASNMVRSRHTCDIKTTGWAAFGQAVYTFMDRLHFTAGLRLDNQYLEGEYHNPVNNASIQEDLDYTEVLPKFSVSFDAAENIMTYASVAKGYLAGGFNWSANSEKNKFNFDPEYCWNYEVGLKSNWLNNRLKANLSVFYIAMDDKQVRVLDPMTLLSTTTNAGKAYSYGLEVQLKATPLAGLQLFANFGYTQAKFDEFISTGYNTTRTGVAYDDLSGNYLPFAPEYTFNAGAQYRSASGFMGRVDIFGTGKFYGDPANSCEQDPYQLVNLRLGYEAKDWEIYLWAKNLFDQEYLTWFSQSGANMYAVDGAPRTFGVTAAYRF